MGFEVSHDVEHAQLMDDFFVGNPDFEELSKLGKSKFEIFLIKGLFKFEVFTRLIGIFQMFQQIIFN